MNRRTLKWLTMVSQTLLVAITGLAVSGFGFLDQGYQKISGKWVWRYDSRAGIDQQDVDEPGFVVFDNLTYAKGKDHVFYKGRVLKDADPTTFQLLADNHGWRFAKDKSHAFIDGWLVDGADGATFSVINGPYCRDASGIYCGTVPVDVAHIDKFEVTVADAGRQMGMLQYEPYLFQYGDAYTKYIDGPGRWVPGSNWNNDRQMGLTPAKAWARDGQYYYCGPARVEGVDYASFHIDRDPILGEFPADKNWHYYQMYPLQEDYKQVNGHWALVREGRDMFGSSRQTVVYQLPTKGADLTILSYPLYAKDNDHVYLEGRMIEGADPATFELLGDVSNRPGFRYGKDAKHVFLAWYRINGADPQSFKILRAPYAKDDHTVYCGTVPVDVADVAHFRVIRQVVLRTRSLPLQATYQFAYGAAYKELVAKHARGVTAPAWASDGQYYYLGAGRVEGVDYRSFIPGPLPKDKNRRYY